MDKGKYNRLIALLSQVDELKDGFITQKGGPGSIDIRINNTEKFKEWKADVVLFLHDFKSEYSKDIINTIEGMKGWHDERDFEDVVAKLNAIKKKYDNEYKSKTNFIAENKLEGESNMKKVFVSHSTKDADLVEEFIDFMEIMGVERNDIYCTSIDGTISTGTNFIDNIKTNIKNTEKVIFIITPEYLKSKFCLAEMGAAWVLNQKIYPIIFKPLDFSILEDTPLKGIQANKIDSIESIISICDEFEKNGLMQRKDTNFINKKSKSLYQKFNEILEMYDNSNYYIDNEQILIENRKLENQVKVMEKYIYDFKEYSEYLRKEGDIIGGFEGFNLRSDYIKGFNKQVDELKGELKQFSNCVIKCIFLNEFRQEAFILNMNDSQEKREIEECIDNNQLKICDNQVYLSNYNIEIEKLIKKLKRFNELIEWIKKYNNNDYYNLAYKYGIQFLNMSEVIFWERVLGQKIHI